VLVEYESNRVLAHAKALTTRTDLAIGIGEAMHRVLAGRAAGEVQLVSVSTTLATNAIVEGRGAPVCALLIGYEDCAQEGPALSRTLGTDRYALIAGGHDISGEEQAPLDLDAARRAILAHAPHVSAYAVSGFFGTRSPEHELAVRDLVRSLTPLPVTCGHELTQRLDALRRAATVALNASLIPLLCDLIAAVEGAMGAEGIRAPLMVVKGDGSLMASTVAKERPIETILSGPAASVVGARHLAAADDCIVVDMGGTTTDIALLHHGRPRLSPQGAAVGRWRTMVEAIDAHTVGLGGDSRVTLDEQEGLVVGPQRVVPVAWLAHRYPGVREELEAQWTLLAARPHHATGEFLLAQREAACEPGEPPTAPALWGALREGPRSLREVHALLRYPTLYAGYLQRLERHGHVARAGLTPTDAAHVLGLFGEWDAEAARLAARLLARRLGCDVEALCRRVIEEASRGIAREVIAKALGDDGLNGHHQETDSALIASALRPREDTLLDCTLRLRPPIVAVGAPVATYFPRVADLLHTGLTLPPHAEVANAVGAVVGSVVARVQALVVPQQEGDVLRVYLPGETADFGALPEAIVHAERRGREIAAAEAVRAGAAYIEIEVEREDHTAPVANGWGADLYVETRLAISAVGRPRLAAR
jgi:N-methylhydantoinase A/oxoprolinase/acetone carboxylase beta subunit